MGARTQKLKQRLLESPFEVCPERAVLWTESMRRSEGRPQAVRNALALRHVLDNMTIAVRPDELIVGNRTSRHRASPLFPETKSFSIEAQLDTYETRAIQPFRVAAEDKKSLRKVLPYWRGRSAWDMAFRLMPRELKRDVYTLMFTVEAEFANGIGHFIVGNHNLLAKGFSGIQKEAEEKLAGLSGSGTNGQGDFLEAVSITCDAASAFAGRFSAEARRQARMEADPHRREELLRIAMVCDRVPKNPPRDFREAIQAVWFNQLICQLECGGFAISPGRLDFLLHPYYSRDLEAGRITPEAAQEVIECFYIKMSEVVNVLDTIVLPVTSGPPIAQSLTIGGQKEDGADATTQLTHLFLAAHDSIRMVMPNLAVRFHAGTPPDFTASVCDAVRRGSMMSLFNDEVIVKGLIAEGVPEKEALEYAIVGCVEPTSAGSTFASTDSNLVNIARCLELALYNGDSMDMVAQRRSILRALGSAFQPRGKGLSNGGAGAGPHVMMLARYLLAMRRRTGLGVLDFSRMLRGRGTGPRTGDPQGFRGMEDLMAAYEKQVAHCVKRMAEAMVYCDKAHAELKPTPFISSCIDDCIERGKDVTQGGARYNFTGPQAIGLADVADSLAAVKTLVFDQGKVSMEGLTRAIRNNFEGEETLRQKLIHRAPRYGNDIEDVDALARQAAAVFCREVGRHPNFRGGRFRPGIYSMSGHLVFGLLTGALPDGRLAGETLGSGVSPVRGRETKGPTAVMRSAAKVDSAEVTNGYVLNMSFDPKLLEGEDNLKKFADLLVSFFRLGGLHVQYNVISAETLKKAQADPDGYRGLVVRVAGYSGLFTELDRATQNDIISRRMHGCEE